MTRKNFTTFEREDGTEVEVEYTISDYDPGVSSGPADGQFWVRAEYEFMDGRFGLLDDSDLVPSPALEANQLRWRRSATDTGQTT